MSAPRLPRPGGLQRPPGALTRRLARAGARALLLALPLALPTARADSLTAPRVPSAEHARECGACHLAYPPGLLPSEAWRSLMGSLGTHFGSDASVDAATRTRLTQWLTEQAARGRRFAEAPTDGRITATRWFQRKHRSIDTAVFSRPAVRGASQCDACHRDAATGGFDDDHARIPR